MLTPKALALALTLGLSALFAVPGVRNALPKRYHAQDSFPVSTFAMFSTPRPPEHRMTWVRALDAAGRPAGRVRSDVYNPGGLNQAMAHLRRARPKRMAQRAAICREIAAHVAAARDLRHVAQVQIVDAWYVPEKVFGPARDEEPERAEVLVTCAVERFNR